MWSDATKYSSIFALVSTDAIGAQKLQDLGVFHLNKGIQSYITAQEEARLNPQ